VRGNVDHGAWSANLPVTQRIEIDGFRIYVLHILAELDPQAADKVDAVIYGHSHQPKIETKNGTLRPSSISSSTSILAARLVRKSRRQLANTSVQASMA
jgi:predicted phosphodiesterase